MRKAASVLSRTTWRISERVVRGETRPCLDINVAQEFQRLKPSSSESQLIMSGSPFFQPVDISKTALVLSDVQGTCGCKTAERTL